MDHHPPTFSEVVASFAQNDFPEQHPPIYVHEEGYEGLWQRWTISDQANQKVLESRGALAILEPKFRSQIKEYERSKQTSSKIFTELHGLSTAARAFFQWSLLRRIYSSDGPDPRERLRQEFKLAVQAETSAHRALETSREKIDSLKAQIQGNTTVASEADHLFDLLAARASRHIPKGSPQIIAIEEHVAAFTVAYTKAQAVVTELKRARTTIQHAHRFFTVTLKILDGVRAMAFSTGGEFVKEREYKLASETAIKAQACYQKTLQVLEPHMNRVSIQVMEDFNKLDEWGLLQASKIFSLLWGEKRAMSGITRTVNMLYKTQEAVFVCLTHIAVWVQEQVPVAEAEVRKALTKRDKGRRQLVAVWKTRIAPERLPNFEETTSISKLILTPESPGRDCPVWWSPKRLKTPESSR